MYDASTRCASLADPRRVASCVGSAVEEPYRLTPQLALRVAILGFVALAIFAVLFLRLWALQVLSAPSTDGGERQPCEDDPHRRSAGTDRRPHGHVLVTNVAGYRVELWPADLPKSCPPARRVAPVATITGTPISAILKGIKTTPEIHSRRSSSSTGSTPTDLVPLRTPHRVSRR